MNNEDELLGDAANGPNEDAIADKAQNEDEDTNVRSKNDQKAHRKSTRNASHWQSSVNKRRRTSLLGNLAAQGRLSRGLSIQKLMLHLTPSERAKKVDNDNLPPEDYYVYDETDSNGIFLEESLDIPGESTMTSLQQMMSTIQAQQTEGQEGEGETAAVETPLPPEAPVQPPEDAVFPVARNTVEQRSKLCIVRSLKTYLQHNRIDEGKCYYAEDELDLSFLTAKPKTFLIFGKPGSGKTTLAARLAEKLHAVHLNPENIIEYFRGPREPLGSIKVNEILEDGESIGDGAVIELLEKRIKEFDILHKGYVLEGFPMITSDDLPVSEQLEALKNLAVPPEYLIILQMQDKDLYKRRITQKFDPETGKVYAQQQYTKVVPDEYIFDRHYPEPFTDNPRERGFSVSDQGDVSISDLALTEELSDTENETESRNTRESTPEQDKSNLNELDFPQLPPEVLGRLFYRTEDFNIIVNDDLESFRYNFQDLQQYVQNFNKRKVLEVDAYWSPNVLFRRVWEFCEATGLQPVPVPVQIVKPLTMMYYKKRDSLNAGEGLEDDEDDDDDDDADDENDDDGDAETICPDDDQLQETDWVAALRAVAVRGLVDPRFRWRVSRWINLCPVALKLGRSIPGKPELAVSFMDKVFFMSSKRAAEQFINNPRPYLLPKMPTSPVKFIVIGHPLAGKTTFANELARITEGTVIDVNREMIKRFSDVKRDFIWKKRLRYSLEATHIVNKENAVRWHRQERARRRDMHAWIENHLKQLAEAEIEAALERDREMLHKLRTELRKASEYHTMGDPFTADGMCQGVDATLRFNWKKFVQQAFGGKSNWTHQELLQLAWDLFHERRLYYKKRKRDSVKLTVFNDFTSESDEEYGLVSNAIGSGSNESSGTESFEVEDEADMEYEGEGSLLDDDLEDETDEEEEKKKIKKKRKKGKKKRKCVRLEVKPVSPEDIVEPFLFDTFDVDPDDPEVEESVRMRFPLIPFELVDIVPAPPQVGDTDAAVQRVVEDKLAKDALHVDTIPPDIFVEILRRACAEVEVKLRRLNRRGPMTGGWIIENFPPDIEKWRALLRTPAVCPDQVFLLLDLTEGNMTIWSRFKRLFRMLHPPKQSESRSSSANKKSVEPIPGEDAQQDDTLAATSADAKNGTPREMPLPGEDGQEPPPPDPLTTENETEQDEVTTQEVGKHSLDLISKSHFIMSLLPKDDLLDRASMTSSEVAVVARDQNRLLTTAISERDSDEEFQKIVEGHQKYIWDSMEKEFADSEKGSFSSLDFEEYQSGLVLKFKPMYVEMSACMEDLDAFQHHGEAVRVSSVSEITKTVQHPPPGTPETAAHSEPEDFSVPVPPEIAAGEIELTAEEEELRTELEDDIRRLSNLGDDDDIRTPTEMASILSMTAPLDNTDSAQQSENEMIIQKLLQTKIESPKRKFFAQIRLFNEFWNMALPVCNQQGVRYWEVGLCDEETSLEKSIFIWNELESRFDAKAKKILETELREEDDEILASLMKWGEPYDLTDLRFRPAMKQTPEEEDVSQDDATESNDDSEANESDTMKDKDELDTLDNKPNLFWKETKRLEAERCFGDFKYYCPVTYADFFVLRKGSPKFACKYKDRLYYCSDENNQLRFLVNPQQFLPTGGPPTAPAPRICITGSPGCLQEEIASQLCNEFKVCYVNFRQRLHEIMKARFGQEVGPNKTGQIVSLDVTRKILNASNPEDDLLIPSPVSKGLHFEDAFRGESQYDSEVEIDMTFVPAMLPNASGILTIPQQEMNNEDDQRMIQNTALRSLGLLSETNIETVPLNSIQRTEKLTERKWQKLTMTETYIQGFLENGVQLPDEILDEFIAPLWKERPFTDVGFILVGFPNTEADTQYLVKRNFIPEHIFVMECKSIVIRNRLIVPTVDRWHKEQNPTGRVKRRLTRRTNLAKLKLGLTAAGVGPSKSEVFQYQTEGRQDVDEFETETWSYNDSISRDISRALKFYHGIYSSGIEKLKKSLNRERIGWTPVDTNTGLQMGKHSVINSIIPLLKYRNNVFEDVCRLSFTAAQALLDRGVFTLSRLHRWCPVEISKGNTGINIWNAPGVKKIPYLHRRFIYFLEGEKNAKHFEENTWNLTNQVPPVQPLPLVCMVLGHPKSGKTMLAKKLAQRLGLLYVSGLEAVESVVTHAFVSQWAQALSEVNPSLAAAGHQTMTLANEVLEYMREGRPVPRYILYRCLDLLLMNPKAQCHGVVFDDFPTILDELIEINYREMTPCLVIDLKIPIEEAYSRCDANRKPELRPETIPEESHECMDYLWDTYENTTMETLRWFSEEYQNVHAIDGRLNPEMIYQQAAEVCINGQRKVQEYCINLYYGRPNTLEGTCPLSSTLFHRLTPDFGFFCPVLLNDADELVSVKEISDLSQVVEYKNQIYLFSSRNAVRKFMNNPKRYTVPGCLRTPPSDISQPLMVTPEDFERLKEHWGFMDFDPVLYFANHHYKGLQRGDPKYCVVYRGKLYVFISEDNQKKFMRKPTKYWNLLLPMKIPRKTEPINYDKITPFAYLSAKGMIPILRKLVKLMAEKRPRVQFMNVDQCAALYMGYYLKSQNMNSPFQRRQKYRDAMFKMSTSKSETKDFLNELQTHYGCRQRNLPERLRQKLDDFLKFEHLSTEEKVLIPKIPGIDFGYDALKTPFSEPQVTRKVRRMMDRMKEVDMREKLDAFSTHSKRKKVAEEAAERAAQDAKEAAELARKIEERSQARLKMKSLSGRAKSLALSSVYTSSFGGKTNFS